MPQNNIFIIAVDGPAASGKGTLARRLAKHFHFHYLDTGSIYRAAAYKILAGNLDPHNEKIAQHVAESISEEDLANPHLYDEGVGSVASIISALPAVRKALFTFQHNFSHHPEGAVLDGRDIGTVICPDARYKFFITAHLDARAERRFKELQNKGFPVIYDAVLEDLRKRDERDSQRDIAPLQPAKGAIHIDTTGMSADEVFINALSYMEN